MSHWQEWRDFQPNKSFSPADLVANTFWLLIFNILSKHYSIEQFHILHSLLSFPMKSLQYTNRTFVLKGSIPHKPVQYFIPFDQDDKKLLISSLSTLYMLHIVINIFSLWNNNQNKHEICLIQQSILMWKRQYYKGKMKSQLRISS